MKTLIIIMAALLFSGCYLSEEEIQKKTQECLDKGEMGVVARDGYSIARGVDCVALPKPVLPPVVKTPVPEVKPASVIDITGTWRNYEDTITWTFDAEGWLNIVKDKPSLISGKKKKKPEEFNARYFKVDSWKGYHIAGSLDAAKVIPITEDILEVTPGKGGIPRYFYRGKVWNTLTEAQVLSDLVKLIREDELWELDHLNKVDK